MRRALIASLVVAACADVGTRVRIVDQVDEDGSYTTRDVELTTLRDLDAVSGDIARMWGGATVRIGFDLSPTDGGGSRETYATDATAVRVSWTADGNVAVPTDFDSLTMLTAYARLEEVTRHFADLDVEIANDAIPVYYNPSVATADDITFPAHDNAAYFPEADAFLLLPPRVLQGVPLAMNPGVIGHEYSHRVLYYRLWRGERFASLEEHGTQPGSLNAWNRLHATDEGVADFFGAAIAGDPGFLGASTPAEIAEPRDLSAERVLDAAWVGGLEPKDDGGGYARYIPGSVVAAALWRIGEIAGVETTERALLSAQDALADQVRDDFEYSFGDLEAAVIGNLPAEIRPDACAALEPLYGPVWTGFAAVCP